MSQHGSLAPRSGDDDTFDVVDDAVSTLGIRRGLWMGDHRVMIHLVASVIEQAERLLLYLDSEARHEGSSWDELASLLGMSAEQAQARFDPASPTADTRGFWNMKENVAGAAQAHPPSLLCLQ